MHVYHTGGWVSQKWGPPPNMDGSPSSESLHPVVTTPASATSPTSPTAPNSGIESSTAVVSTGSIEEPASRPPPGLISEPAGSQAAVHSVRSESIDTSLTTATPSTSSAYREKSASKSLRMSSGVGGDFEVVSKTELDDDKFDVIDCQGPSATNGATETFYAVAEGLSVGWEDDE
jgi:hypothetical protein